MKKRGVITVLLFVTLMLSSQNKNDIELIRKSFQEIKNEDDIDSILAFRTKGPEGSEMNIIRAYQGAAQCMMANYVFSSISKLKNFNQGKTLLEESIEEDKSVENVYLRLLIQLNVPGILGYYKNIDGDILFLGEHLSSSTIDITYKNLIIQSLVSVAKNKEQKDALLKIKLLESS